MGVIARAAIGSKDLRHDGCREGRHVEADAKWQAEAVLKARHPLKGNLLTDDIDFREA